MSYREPYFNHKDKACLRYKRVKWREKKIKHDGERGNPGGVKLGLPWTAVQVAHCTTLKCPVRTVIRVDVCIYQDSFPAGGSKVSQGSGTLLYLAQNCCPGWQPCSVTSPSSVLESPEHPELEQDLVAFVLVVNSLCR